jgi:hypothetical protein
MAGTGLGSIMTVLARLPTLPETSPLHLRASRRCHEPSTSRPEDFKEMLSQLKASTGLVETIKAETRAASVRRQY